ncbi:lysylphosphatidylglycerol synthase transmembrane domain-containing protein [Frankia tisae]|uniref:lysylphosphatidylglycerol synthase transmembrane domain-containing protein n=1 Tax=Frankia tisae TaxID=2950104 RepID=UPI0021C00008|nr:lysylphosphatidylglycerol synthase transmembrane domain-containing protein [Frankia tisae]
MGQHIASAEPADASARRSGRGPRWWLVRGALLVALGLMVLALASQWNDVRDSFRLLTVGSVVASGVATILAVGTTVLSWRALLAGLGAELPLRAAVRIFFVGQIGKYIPGSVWPVLAQMELSRDYGISRPKAASASLVVLALAVPSGGLAAAITLPFVSADALASYWWALAAVPVFAVLLYPSVLSRLLALAFRLLRRAPLDEPLTLRPIAVGAGWLLVSFCWYGLATWLLVRDLDPEVGGGRLMLLSVGAYALAWTAGFLVLVVPAGAGVREAVLVLALAPAVAGGPATLVALVARLLATVADLVWAGVGVALRGRGARRTEAGMETDPRPGASAGERTADQLPDTATRR